MRSRAALFVLAVAVCCPTLLSAHSVTVGGVTAFTSLDGSLDDHDGSANGVFTVGDGDLIVNGVIQCNDDAPKAASEGACAMSFAVSGNLVVNAGGALVAENRNGGGAGGAITLNVGRDLVLRGATSTLAAAIVSSAASSSTSAAGGAITASIGNAILIEQGATVDAGSANAAAGRITLAAGGPVTIDGNVLSGPSRTLLATRLSGAALGGGTANQSGGEIVIRSASYSEPGVAIGGGASVVSQGESSNAGPVSIDGCGVVVKGLVAALSRKDGAARLLVRSGKDLLVDARDLGVAGATAGRGGRLRADALTGTAVNRKLGLFAGGTIDILGPDSAASTLFAVSSLPGTHDAKSVGGTIRLVSTGGRIHASGNVIDDGHTASGDTGGTIVLAARGEVTLENAALRAIGDFSTSNPVRGGGSINIRSFQGNVGWTNGLGEVRPTGSGSGLAASDQGSISLTACGTIDVSGTSFPTLGAPVGTWPTQQSGVCSAAAPDLPAGEPALPVCNTPPVANAATASTNEDTSVVVHLSGSDPDGDPLTFTITGSPSKGTTGVVTSTGPASADVTYIPNPNANGSDAFTFSVSDGRGGSASAVATITIAPVNDPPSFVSGGGVVALEDAGAQTVSPWATSISAGPADESAQTVAFSVTNDNNALFSTQPSVAPSGILTYSAAPDAFGTATVSVVAHDDGGTSLGGSDSSAAQSFTITVTPVNDAPSFVKGADQTAGEDGGAQSVAGWASGISAGPNESGQTVAFTLTSDNTSLFSAQPAVDPAGTLTYTPASNANGLAKVSVYAKDDGGTADGGVDTSPAQTFTIAVTAVNDAPSFTKGADQTVLEDSGPHTVSGWATAISAGPPDEAGQSVTFAASNDNNALFSSQPAVDASGNLSFQTAANAFGSATVTVTLSDDGGTAGGGVNTSAAQTFVINVTGVNDAPSFTKGPDVTVSTGAGAQSFANWATGISAGPNESGQSLTFSVTSDNAALFAVAPAISAAGTLTFTPNGAASGTANVTVTMSDNGGTANGGTDTSAAQTFTITITHVNQAPAAAADTYDTIGNTELAVGTAGSGGVVVVATGSLLDNDTDADTPHASLTASLGTASAGAIVTVNANGTFTYVPPVGATGTDTFTYSVSDGAASSTGTVTIHLVQRAWYVKNTAAAGGSGRSNTPFNTLLAAQTASAAGDTIYLFAGDGTSGGQNAGITLKNNQRLIGEGVALTFNASLNGAAAPVTLRAAGSAPAITSTTGPGVTVANAAGIEIAGLGISGTSSGISVSTSTANSGAAIHHVNVHNTAGAGIAVSGSGTATLTLTLANSTVAQNPTAGLITTLGGGVSGTVDVTGNTLSDNNVGLDIGSGQNADVTFQIQNNTILRSNAGAINIVTGTDSTNGSQIKGTVSGNAIGDTSPDSGSRTTFGIAVDSRGDVDGILAIKDNVIQHTEQDGIFIQTRLDNDLDTETQHFDLTLTGNSVGRPDDNQLSLGNVYGVRVESRNTSSLCMNISLNTAASAGTFENFRVRQRDTSAFRLEGFSGTGTSASAVASFIASRNSTGSTASATVATTFTGVTSGTCRTP